MDIKDGFRADMLALTGFCPSLDDLSLAVRAQPHRIRYIFYKYIGYFCQKTQADQDDFLRMRAEMKQEGDLEEGDLFLIQPYKKLKPGECCEVPSIPVIEIVDPKNKKERIRYQPFAS